MNEAKNAPAMPAGDFLAGELQERGWTQVEFADILGRPAQFVSEIIKGKKEITRESATQLGAALGTSAQLWLNLQDQYFLQKQREDVEAQAALDAVRLRARLKELAPVAVLVKRGYLTPSDPTIQASELLDLYKMSSLEDEPSLALAARRNNLSNRLTPTQLAWTAVAREVASSAGVGTFSQTELVQLAQGLSATLRSPDDFLDLPTRLADVGVALVYVEAFPGSRIDGCAFILDDGTPAIALSGRGKRLDKVLFTLLHEIAHLTLGHVDGERLILDDSASNPITLGDEAAADAQASEWILPERMPEPPKNPRIGWVHSVANALGVAPIVVIGRLQILGILDWRTALVKGAPTVDQVLSNWQKQVRKLAPAGDHPDPIGS